MMLHGDLPDKIPLFPLPGALLLPRARLPLQIFEPRYLAMLEDTLKTSHRLIGMIQPRPGPEGQPAPGCDGLRGTGDRVLRNRRRALHDHADRYLAFRLQREVSGFAPYLSGDVRWDGFERDRGGTEHDPGSTGRRFWGSWPAILPPRNWRRTGTA